MGERTISRINLNEIIEETSHQLEEALSDHAELRFNFAVNIPAIEGEPEDISLAVTNLVTNAHEALGGKLGSITCTTGSFFCDHAYLEESVLPEKPLEGNFVFLEVSDTGQGMTEETRRKMFEPTFSTRPASAGLGLVAVLNIVRDHGGALRVTSAPSLGSTFTMLFPALPHAAMSQETEEEEIPEDWRGRGTILLVDDAKTCLAVGGRILERRGFKVLKAETGREAVELLGKCPREITCIVLDLVMPEMDGYQTLPLLREIRPDVPVIISSGYSEQEIVHRFDDHSVQGFIQKPYRASVILQRVKCIVEDCVE